MRDIVLDTNFLAEFIDQFYNEFRNSKEFLVKGVFSVNLVRQINQIVQSYDYGGVFLILASALAFVEIGRKFDQIANNHFSTEQFKAFINQPPEWFSIASIDDSLFLNLLDIPPTVVIDNQIKNIEWADAVHLATALSRENGFLATSDIRISSLDVTRPILI